MDSLQSELSALQSEVAGLTARIEALESIQLCDADKLATQIGNLIRRHSSRTEIVQSNSKTDDQIRLEHLQSDL